MSTGARRGEERPLATSDRQDDGRALLQSLIDAGQNLDAVLREIAAPDSRRAAA
jgi:hypothetical protein